MALHSTRLVMVIIGLLRLIAFHLLLELGSMLLHSHEVVILAQLPVVINITGRIFAVWPIWMQPHTQSLLSIPLLLLRKLRISSKASLAR